MVRALVSSRLREKGVEEFRTLGLELAGTRFISLPHRFGARMLWGAAERQNAGAPREREGWLEYQRLGFEARDPLLDVPVNEFSYVPAFIHPSFHHLSPWEHCLLSPPFLPSSPLFIHRFIPRLALQLSRVFSLLCEKIAGREGVKTTIRSLE